MEDENVAISLCLMILVGSLDEYAEGDNMGHTMS